MVWIKSKIDPDPYQKVSPRVLQFELAVMSIRTHFKPKDGLHNPKGPVSQSIPLQPIALANIEVAKATRDKSKKRLPSILPDKCGSLEYSRAFQTLPWWAASHSLWAFA